MGNPAEPCRLVSIHTPTKGVTAEDDMLHPSGSVSIHTPTKGVTTHRDNNGCRRLCFNPHTHEGCDHPCRFYCDLNQVSIHTPTKGVTLRAFWLESTIVVSIHTPTKGVTSANGSISIGSACFNPHTHEGCDFLVVAITMGEASFNPHTHEGCDLSYH